MAARARRGDRNVTLFLAVDPDTSLRNALCTGVMGVTPSLTLVDGVPSHVPTPRQLGVTMPLRGMRDLLMLERERAPQGVIGVPCQHYVLPLSNTLA